jgi:AcrR family transcriptional regulator
MENAQHDPSRATEKLPRGSHGLPPEFVVRSQRDRLFAGMARAMLRSGFAATTVDDIAIESGVSRKALYAHFSGKEDLLLQAHRAVAAQLVAGGKPIVGEQASWDRTLRSLLDWTLEFFAREPAFAHLTFVEMPAATPTSRRLQRESLNALRELVESIIAQQSAPISPVMVDCVVGGLVYVVARTAQEGHPDDLRALRPQLMAWLMLMIEGPLAAEHQLADNMSLSPRPHPVEGRASAVARSESRAR